MHRQLSFDPLNYTSPDDNHNLSTARDRAKEDRDAAYRDFKAEGKIVHRSVLKNQLRKYASFGVEDGRVRDVFYLDVY